MMKKAFTLAEVLITLTLLGIVAVVAIPNMIRGYKERETVTKVREAYSILNNGFDSYVAENGIIKIDQLPYQGEYLEHKENGEYIRNLMLPYFRINKKFEYNDGSRWAYSDNGTFKNYKKGGTNVPNLRKNQWAMNPNGYYGFQLKNGMNVYISPGRRQWRQTKMGNFIVDINGDKPPARLGYDIFYFPFSTKGFFSIRKGDLIINNDAVLEVQPGFCKSTADASENNANGQSCATWILKHGNLDYQRRDVSAEW